MAVATSAAAQTGAGPNWPSFRGPSARGAADGHSTSVRWNVDDAANILWKARIPGLAHSSPVVWGDRIFVTTAVRLEGESALVVGLYGSPVPAGEEGPHRFQVLCLDKHTGETIWARTAIEAVPAHQRHPKGSHAASTPATDGRSVVACFASEGLYAFDMDGESLWTRDLGDLDSGWYMAPGAQFGFASSPVLHDGRVILQIDVQEGSSLRVLDAATGSDVWRVQREDVPTWSTPTVDVEGGRSQIIVNGYRHMGGYDLATGEERWRLSGGGDVPVPTPIVHDGVVYITNGHGRWNPIYAIAASARGEITDAFEPDGQTVLWSQRRRGTYMQTPILYRGHLFASNDAGVVTCIDPKTGEHLERRRLGDGKSGFTASPVAADGKLYFTSEEGEVHVLDASAEMNVLAVNAMGETCMATPAISEGILYFRTRGHLVAVFGDADVAASLADSHSERFGPASPIVEAAVTASDLPEAHTLFAGHLKARGGGEALARPETVEVIGTLSIPSIGLEGSMRSLRASGARYVSLVDLGAMGVTRQGHDGATGWMIAPSTGATLLEGEHLDRIELEANWLGDVTYRETYPEMRTVGRGDFHGFDCYVVETKSVIGRSSTHYFEVGTGLVRGRDEIAPVAGEATRVVSIFRIYGEFEGISVPVETEVRIPEYELDQVIRVDEVRFDGLDECDFALPPEIAELLDG